MLERLTQVIDAVEERRERKEEVEKGSPGIGRRIMDRIFYYVERFENWVYRMDPRNWAWE